MASSRWSHSRLFNTYIHFYTKKLNVFFCSGYCFDVSDRENKSCTCIAVHIGSMCWGRGRNSIVESTFARLVSWRPGSHNVGTRIHPTPRIGNWIFPRFHFDIYHFRCLRWQQTWWDRKCFSFRLDINIDFTFAKQIRNMLVHWLLDWQWLLVISVVSSTLAQAWIQPEVLAPQPLLTFGTVTG